ncbi:unnamed protein product [Zymoseptoria tritici ST99CH_1E4]|uniref:Alpha/beta hydrolase fold-3 domain-containing protein n=1 Tax=Zymoseptoria tritici ST99CH_1E4 TaxID=1276532 RepID=A0A2H1G3N8_ZYMTR|nr:unnamed protein product [Zymoseptoria tritici ST99CH_1E4]
MDSPLAAIKLLFPHVPSLSWTAAQHTLGISPTASKWDLRSELTVHVLRAIASPKSGRPAPLSKVQRGTLKDPGVKGKTWIAKATISRPPKEDEGQGKGLRDVVFQAIEAMKKEGNVLHYEKPELKDLEVEWTGFRPGAKKDEGLPDVDEKDKYRLLMAEPCRSSEATVLYFHGGAYYLCDPATHRGLTSRLAKESSGRVCSVRYRLAPQTAFPGQLIDALMAYLSLIYPPSNSLHEAVPAERIVLAGDSAGANLAFALLQLLLQLHRTADGVPLVKFHGRDVHVPLPAGVSGNSGWFDVSRAMPSIVGNSKWDYLPPANHDDAVGRFPADSIWPTKPPRGDIYCDLSMLDHPLVSPVLAESWKASPPLWMNTGDEMLMDEDILVAARAAGQGVKVHFEHYEAMPHCFPMLLPHLPASRRCLRSWGNWIRRVVEEPEGLKTNGVWIPARKGKEKEVDVMRLPAVEFGEARRLVGVIKERRIQGFKKGEGVKATL